MKTRNIAIMLVLLILICWPIYQLYSLFHLDDKHKKTAVLLFQVANFQFELTDHLLEQSPKAASTTDLNELKQAVYTMNYTHEHLMQAFPQGKLTDIVVMNQLLQYILRLQMGGSRTLSTIEKSTLERVAQTFDQMYQVYGTLLNEDGGINASTNRKIAKLDATLSASLKSYLLK